MYHRLERGASTGIMPPVSEPMQAGFATVRYGFPNTGDILSNIYYLQYGWNRMSELTHKLTFIYSDGLIYVDQNLSRNSLQRNSQTKDQ